MTAPSAVTIAFAALLLACPAWGGCAAHRSPGQANQPEVPSESEVSDALVADEAAGIGADEVVVEVVADGDMPDEWWPACAPGLGPIVPPMDWSVRSWGDGSIWFKGNHVSTPESTTVEYRTCGVQGQSGRLVLPAKLELYSQACNQSGECLLDPDIWSGMVQGAAPSKYMIVSHMAGANSSQSYYHLAQPLALAHRQGCSPLTADFKGWSALICYEFKPTKEFAFSLVRLRLDGTAEPLAFPDGWKPQRLTWSDSTFAGHQHVLADLGYAEVVLRIAANEAVPVAAVGPPLPSAIASSAWHLLYEEGKEDLWIWYSMTDGSMSTLGMHVRGAMAEQVSIAHHPNFYSPCGSGVGAVEQVDGCTGDIDYTGKYIVSATPWTHPEIEPEAWCVLDAESGANWCRKEPKMNILGAVRNKVGFLLTSYIPKPFALGSDLYQTDFFGNKSAAESGPCATMAMAACGDTNPCTSDRCDAAHRGCWHEPMTDGLPCGAGQVCSGGACL